MAVCPGGSSSRAVTGDERLRRVVVHPGPGPRLDVAVPARAGDEGESVGVVRGQPFANAPLGLAPVVGCGKHLVDRAEAGDGVRQPVARPRGGRLGGSSGPSVGPNEHRDRSDRRAAVVDDRSCGPDGANLPTVGAAEADPGIVVGARACVCSRVVLGGVRDGRASRPTRSSSVRPVSAAKPSLAYSILPSGSVTRTP